MKTGKLATQDPRMAPGKAPRSAPDAMEKPMPEYPMDISELVYPGDAAPFTSKAGVPERMHDSPSHPAVPQTEVPRNKLHLDPIGVKALVEECLRCIKACDRCAEMETNGPEGEKYYTCTTVSRMCSDMCTLLRIYLGNALMSEIARMAVDLAAVCARVCETCVLTCGQHPEMEVCTKCAAACRACADQCRRLANA